MDRDWYHITNVAMVSTPALVIYPERVLENIRRAIGIARGPQRLRPHIKTHKCAEIVKMHLDLGVRKFKCSTLAEVEMAARAGASDLLLAYPLTGPNYQWFQAVRATFPWSRIAAVCDNAASARELSAIGENSGEKIPVYLDIDCGMHRTGIEPGDAAVELGKTIRQLNGLELAGLHAYDGHIDGADAGERRRECEESFAPVLVLKSRLEAEGVNIHAVIAGGTPTFPIHAAYLDRECSPGTYVFWDFGYRRFADLDFEIAALVLARIVSKPAHNRLCVDLGYKAVASESPPPRVEFMNLPDATAVGHSEEHLVLETPNATTWNVGDVLYGIPRHICPTVALYDVAWPILKGTAQDPLRIQARTRILTI